MPQVTKSSEIPDFSKVEDKIHLEKQIPFSSEEKKGPHVDLFFHELTSEKHLLQKILGFLGSTILSLIFFLSYPLIALLIKLFAKGEVIQKVSTTGRRGIVFERYLYPTKDTQTKESYFFGTFLKKSSLYKLPSILNVWKGEMNLIGPAPYAQEKCNKWNKEFSDYYKRFALKPGFFPVADVITNSSELEQVARSLEKELNYILNPSLKKDIKHLLQLS